MEIPLHYYFSDDTAQLVRSLMTDMPTFALSCGRSSFPTSKFLGLPVYFGFFTSLFSILLPS